MNTKSIKSLGLLAVTALLAGVPLSGIAQTVTVGTTTPSVGDGVQYLGDSVNGGSGNVNYSYVPSDYIAGDNNACLGQLFTTGNNASGYQLNSISFMQVANTDTYYSMNGLGSQGIRVFSLGAQTASGGGGFDQAITVLDSETIVYPNAQNGTTHSTPGANAWWVTVSFSAPLTLAANTQYGFDLQTDGVGGNGDFFMEWNGTGADGYSGGQAIVDGGGNSPNPTSVYLAGTGSPNGTPGDRTFVASMTAVAPVPEPSTMVLAGLGGFALLMLRRRQA